MMTSLARSRAISVACPKLLLVEGQDDRRFFNAFARYLRIGDMQTEMYGGTGNLANVLDLLVSNPNFDNITSLGIIRDADRDKQFAFDSVVGLLRQRRLPTPTMPIRPVTTGGISVSILIIPPDSDAGALEDLCLSALAGDNPLLDCADQYLECAAGAGVELRQRAKSRLHAYLAVGDEPGRRLGEAADAGVWDWSSPAFARIMEFLQNL